MQKEEQGTQAADCIYRPTIAAGYLGISLQSIYRFVRLGLLPPPIKLGLRASGWRRSDLDKFIEERANGGRVA